MLYSLSVFDTLGAMLCAMHLLYIYPKSSNPERSVCMLKESDLEKSDSLLKVKERGSAELWLDSVSTVLNSPSHNLHASITPPVDTMIVKVPVL